MLKFHILYFNARRTGTILLRCEELVPFFHKCEESVPNPHAYEESVPNPHICQIGIKHVKCCIKTHTYNA